MGGTIIAYFLSRTGSDADETDGYRVGMCDGRHGSTATGCANHHCRILIVEDDCSIASLIADVLEDEIGVSTVTLHNGAEAIRFLAQQEVSLVVLDYQLPGANGIQICDAMRHLASARETPVLFVTANAEQADFQHAGTTIYSQAL